MGKSTAPSLKVYAKEADVFRKQVEKLQKKCAATLGSAATPKRSDKMKIHYQECTDLRNDMLDLQKRVTKMSKADEPTKMTNFDGKKGDELKRLQKMIDQVKEMEKSFEPDETEDEYFSPDKKYTRKIKEDLSSEERAAEDEDEEGEEEEGDEEEYTDEEEEGEEESLGEEEESEYTDEEEEEATEDEDQSDTEPRTPDIRMDYEVQHDFVKQEDGDLSVNTGDIVTLISVRDDGWWQCETVDGVRGYIPSNFLKQRIKYKDLMVDDEATTPTTPRTGKALWGSIKQAVNETSATDVLHALGAVPAGFREPTSGKLQTVNDKHSHKNYNSVKLSNSNLFYKDLFYNPQTQRVRPRTARVQKVVTLLEAKNIPLPGLNCVVKSRLARLSLFDGTKFLSNIVTVQAICTDKEGKNWRFVSRPNCLESHECFVRIAEPSNITGIMIELSFVYTRENSDKAVEVSCGWGFKPLFEDNGTLILNKEYELTVNGGTPYEKNIEVDPSIARRTSSKFMSLLSKNKQPILTLKTAAANNEQKERFDALPSVLVGKLCYLHASAIYRYHLACVLIRDRDNLQSTEGIFDPFLNHFPALLEQPDLTDILLDQWETKLKAKNRTDRRDLEVLTTTLVETFTEWVYPLMHVNLPAYRAGHTDSIQKRKDTIDKFKSVAMTKNSPVAAMLDPSIEHEPFDMNEVSYTMTGPHCITVV